MKRSEPKVLRVGIIGAGALCEHLLLPALSGPDVLAAPDDGAWWLRRAAPNVDISFAPPFRIEVAALCDADPARLKRVGEAARIGSLYTDWKRLLAEHSSPQASASPRGELDALFLALPPSRSDEILVALSARRLQEAAAWLWLAGPPALSSRRARELSALHAHRVVWCARPLGRALAHRAARRMIGRGEIGLVRALSLRWHTPLPPAPPAFDASGSSEPLEPGLFEREVASVAGALDLLLEFAAPEASRDSSPRLERLITRMHAHHNAGTSVALIEFASGVGASLVLSAGDEWSAPLPRLEVVGAGGRFLVCEGGREMRLYAPREAVRSWSPPALAPALSGAEASGVAEDVRAFLNALLQSRLPTRASLAAGDAGEEEARVARGAHSLGRASAVLQFWEDLAGATEPRALSQPGALAAEGEAASARPQPQERDGRSDERSEERTRAAFRRAALAEGTLPLPFEVE